MNYWYPQKTPEYQLCFLQVYETWRIWKTVRIRQKKKICTWIVSWIEKQTIFLFYRYANVCSIPNSPLNKFHIIPFPRNSSYSCKWNLEWSRRQESQQLLSCTPVSCVCVCGGGGSNTQQFSGTYWYSRGPQLIEYWEGLGA